MKKWMKWALIAALLAAVLCCASALAESSGTCGDNLTWVLKDEGTLTISGTGAMIDYSTIIEPYYLENVTSAPWGYTIKNVVIEDGVTSIGDYAFYNCWELKSISLGDGVLSIGNNAINFGTVYANFDSDSAKTISRAGHSFRVPGTKYNLKYLYYDNNDSITGLEISDVDKDVVDFIIPNGVTKIGDWSFIGCHELLSVLIPDTVTEIEYDAFNGCRKLESIVIPNNVTYIGPDAFKDCTGLKSLTLPEDYPSNRYCNAFETCSGLEFLSIPHNCLFGFYSMFYDFSSFPNLTEIEITGSGEMVNHNSNDSRFKNSSVKRVSIKNGITYIGEYAFCGFSGLTSISIPVSVTSIGGAAFYDCNILEAVHVPMLENWLSITFCDYASNPCAMAHHLYINDEEVTQIELSDDVTSIGNYAFYGCSYLSSITIPDSVTSIGDYAFSGCSDLLSITIPASVTSIGDHAFFECSNLSSITIPESVTSIGNYAFSGCSSLGTMYYKEWVFNLNGFYGMGSCGSEVDYIIGNNGAVYIYGEGEMDDYSTKYDSFYKKTVTTAPWAMKIKSAIIEDGVSSIGGYAFYGCDNMSSIDIPASITIIGSNAFYNCNAIRYANLDSAGAKALSKAGLSFRVPETNYDLKYLYENENISGIELSNISKDVSDFTIPVFVTRIGSNAFSNCSSLTDIEIPNSIVSIASNAFTNCNAIRYADLDSAGAKDLSKAYLTFRVPETDYDLIYLYTNENVSGLEIRNISKDVVSFTIPDYVTSIGSSAFSGCTDLTSISIPDSVTSIGSYAFSGCSNLPSIVVPSSVTNIADYAFNNCGSLEHVTIENAKCQVGPYSSWNNSSKSRVFQNCSQLKHIRFADVTIDSQTSVNYFGYCGNHAVWYIEGNNRLVIAGTGAIYGYTYISTAYGTSCNQPWYPYSIYSLEIQEGITEIGSTTFGGRSLISRIYIPRSLVSIGYNAFEYINASVYYIPTAANKSLVQNYGGSLTWVKPSGSCGEDAGWYMDSETTLVLTGPGAVTEADWPDYMQAITTVVVADNVSGIGNNVLGTLPLIQRVVFLGDALELSDAAFAGVTADILYPHGHPSWSEDARDNYGGSVSWSLYCAWHDGDTVAASIRHFDAAEPTCTETGLTDCWRCTACGRGFADEAATTYLEESDYIIPAQGHDWNEPTYEWDGANASATRVCKRNADHVESETIIATAEITKAPTCVEEGEQYLTAVFENEAFETQTNTGIIPIDPDAHVWGEPVFTWSEDNSEMVALCQCTLDESHIATETVQTSSEVTLLPTCESKGEIVYTAAFESELFGTQTKAVEIPELIDISEAVVTPDVPAFDWDGTAKTTSATVMLDGEALTEGIAYTLSLSNNTNAGDAVITATGMGLYGGTATGTFRIVPKDLSSATVNLSSYSFDYIDDEIKPTVSRVMLDSESLATACYSVSYEDNVAVGTAKAIVTGRGNYAGQVVRTFTIRSTLRAKRPDTGEMVEWVPYEKATLHAGDNFVYLTKDLTSFTFNKRDYSTTSTKKLYLNLNGKSISKVTDITVDNSTAYSLVLCNTSSIQGYIEGEHPYTTYVNGTAVSNGYTEGNAIIVRGSLDLYDKVTIRYYTNSKYSDDCRKAAIIVYGDLNMHGGSITDCKTRAISTIGGNVRIMGGTISNCSGGIYDSNWADWKGTIEISGGIIENNTTDRGGAICSYNGIVAVSGGVLRNNTASLGGAIYADHATLTISGGTISGNTATDRGSAVYYPGSYATTHRMTMTGGSITGNTSTLINGGAVMLDYASIDFSGGEIVDNKFTGYGGGTCVGLGGNGSCIFYIGNDATISGNILSGSAIVTSPLTGTIEVADIGEGMRQVASPAEGYTLIESDGQAFVTTSGEQGFTRAWDGLAYVGVEPRYQLALTGAELADPEAGDAFTAGSSVLVRASLLDGQCVAGWVSSDEERPIEGNAEVVSVLVPDNDIAVQALVLDDPAIPRQYHTGEAHHPEPIIVLNGNRLSVDEDYTLTWGENIEVGVGTVTVSAVNEPTWHKTLTFEIWPYDDDWETPVYTWADDNTSVSAERIYREDAAYVEQETVAVSSEVSQPATCTTNGKTTYTSAAFKNEAFEVQTKTLDDVLALDHAYGEPTYTWSADNIHVTAARVCAHDESHVEEETVTAKLTISKAPTEMEMGETIYKASFENSAFEPQERTLEDIPPLSTMSLLSLPAMLTTIEAEAFEGAAFDGVILPDGCTAIGSRAFADCPNLVYIWIPAGLTDIAPDAFEGSDFVRIDRAD